MRACACCGQEITYRAPNAIYCWLCSPKARGMSKAHGIVAYAIRRGQILAPVGKTCADCGKRATEYEHRDYSNPLQVVAVCRTCNRRRGPAKAAARVAA